MQIRRVRGVVDKFRYREGYRSSEPEMLADLAVTLTLQTSDYGIASLRHADHTEMQLRSNK